LAREEFGRVGFANLSQLFKHIDRRRVFLACEPKSLLALSPFGAQKVRGDRPKSAEGSSLSLGDASQT
jgi:hypothetical protein